ncbi:hypothetical protein PBI_KEZIACHARLES14_33 [Mycobacterium phage Keziacharles14]|nr:hypothetical protein PBI_KEZIACHARLES14_33 [Mycobacterium phage Keziacharles14]
MAYGMSSYLANKLLDHTFRNVAYTPPTAIYAKMHLGDPGAAGTANASAVTTRVATTFAAAASGSIAINNLPEFTLAGTETIVSISFWDASTGGNFLYSVLATVSKGGGVGDIIRINTNSIGFTPIAA